MLFCRVTAGELCKTNYKEIRLLIDRQAQHESLLDTFQEEVQTNSANVDTKLENMSIQLQSLNDQCLSLESTHVHYQKQFEAVATQLESKVDHSTLSHIETLAARLEKHHIYQLEVNKKLKDLDEQLEDLNLHLHDMEMCVEELNMTTKQLVTSTQTKASQQEVQIIASEIIEFSNMLNSCASHDSVVQVKFV